MAAMYGPGGEYMGEIPDEVSAPDDRLRRGWATAADRGVRTFAASLTQMPSMAAGSLDLARQVPVFFSRFGQRIAEQASPEGSTIYDRIDRLRRIPYGDTALRALADTQYNSHVFGDTKVEDIDQQANAARQSAAEAGATITEANEAGIEEANKHKAIIPKLSERYDRFTNKVLGAPQPEERNLTENVIYGIAPGLLPSKAKGALSLIDPRTTNFTPSGVALNAGIGGAVSGLLGEKEGKTPEQIAYEKSAKPIAKDETVVQLPSGELAFDTTPKTENEDVTAKQRHDENAASFWTPMAAVTLFGLSLGRHSGSNASAVLKRMQDMQSQGVIHGGAPHTPKAEPSVKSRIAYGLDEMTSVTRNVQEATGNRESAQRAVDASTDHIHHNAGAKVDMFRTQGTLGTRQTVSIRELKQDYDSLGDPQMQNAFDTGIAIKQRLGDREKQVFQLDQERQSTVAWNQQLNASLTARRLSVSQRDKIYEQLATNNKRLAEIQDDMAKITQDLPESRTSLVDLDYQTLKSMEREFDANPQFVALEQKLKRLADDDLDYRVQSGVMTRQEADYQKQFRYVMPYFNDPAHGEKNFFRRAMILTKEKYLGLNENPYGDPGAATARRAFGPIREKNLEVDPLANRVNTPINWLDAWDRHMEQGIRHIERMNFKRSVIDAIQAGPNWSNVMEILPSGNMPLWSYEALQRGINNSVKTGGLKERLDELTIIPRGQGQYQVVHVYDPMLRTTLEQTPLTSWPVLREMASLFRRFTTGDFNPAFAPKSALYDMLTINFNRPAGTVQGTDAILNRVSYALSGKTLPQPLSDSIRYITTAYDPGIVGNAIVAAVTSFARQNEVRIGKALADGLSSTSPFFGALTQVPGGKQFLQRLGQHMVNDYGQSLYSALTDNLVANNHEIMRTVANIRRSEKILNARIPLALRVAGSPATEIWHQYKMALTSIESSARVSYAMENIQLLAAKSYGGDWTKIPKPELKRIMNDARTLGADFARKPGSKLLQGVTSAVPYSNIMIQTVGVMTRRSLDHPGVTALAMAGVVVPTIMSHYYMSNWDEAALNWFYNETPDFKRVSQLVLPTPETMYELATTGKLPPFSPDKVMTLVTVPELRPIAAPIAEALRSLGAYGPASNQLAKKPGIETTMTALGESLKQALDIGLPVPVQAALVAAGVKGGTGNLFNLVSRLGGANPDDKQNSINFFTPSLSAGRAGGDYISPNGLLTKQSADVVSTLFGMVGGFLTQAFHTGYEVYQQDGKDLVDAVMAGVTEVAQRERKYAKNIQSYGLWDANDRIYRKNPQSDELNEMTTALEVVAGRNATIRKPVGDPVLDQIAAQIRWSLRNDPRLSATLKRYGQINEMLKSIDGNRRMTFDEREKAKEPYMKELLSINRTRMLTMRDMQERYASTFGPKYQERFGVPFSYQDFKKRIQEANRNRISALSNRTGQ